MPIPVRKIGAACIRCGRPCVTALFCAKHAEQQKTYARESARRLAGHPILPKAPFHCSICDRKGHTRLTCPTLAA